MSMGAVVATYLSAWCVLMLAALLWSSRRGKSGNSQAGRGDREPAQGMALLPLMLSTSFIAALVSALVVFVVTMKIGAS